MKASFAFSMGMALASSSIFCCRGALSTPPRVVKVSGDLRISASSASILAALGAPTYFLVMMDSSRKKRVETWIYPKSGKKFLIENGRAVTAGKFTAIKGPVKATQLHPSKVNEQLTPAAVTTLFGKPSKVETSRLGTRHKMTVLRYFPPQDTKSFCFIDDNLTCVTAGFAYDPERNKTASREIPGSAKLIVN